MPIQDEKTFHSATEIKYIFQKSKSPCDFLVVVFSSFSPRGSPPAYNYMRTLQGIDVNKLFILDDQGERGCYYLGKNRLFDVEASVVSLVTWISNRNRIPPQNIICCGSSKGGYAALYFGIKYAFGHVVAGAPQSKLGTYLKFAREYPTLEFIAGDSSDESVKFLDSLLYDIVSDATIIPEISIHVGSGDHHYKDHVLPFVNHLNACGFSCELDVKDFSDHGDVRFFQEFLVDKIIEKTGTSEFLRIVRMDTKQVRNKFYLCAQANKQVQYAWYVYKNNERIKVKWYTPEPEFNFEADEPGEYRFMVFAKDNNGLIVSKETGKYMVEHNGRKKSFRWLLGLRKS